jgi:hypothetical protein
MKTAVEQFFKDFYLYAEPYAYSIEEDKWVINEEDFKYLISKAKEMENNIAQEYAEFCIRCDRAGLPIVKFNDWKKELTFKPE